MEEFFLGSFLAGQKLDIVDEQDIDIAVAVSKGRVALVLDRVDEFVGEGFAGHVHYLLFRGVGHDVIADGLHQVGFAETDAAVDKQRVVLFRRGFCDGDAGRVGEAVVFADDEAFKGVLWIDAGAVVNRRCLHRFGFIRLVGFGAVFQFVDFAFIKYKAGFNIFFVHRKGQGVADQVLVPVFENRFVKFTGIWDLKIKFIAADSHRFEGFKPGGEADKWHFLFNGAERFFPYFVYRFFHIFLRFSI